MPKTMREQLLALKSAVAEGDADAIKQADELREKIENADRAQNLLAFMANGEKSAAADKQARTIGEFAEKNLDLSAVRAGTARSAATGYGFKAYTDPVTGPTITDVDRRVVDVPGRDMWRVRSLFGAERISGNTLQYFVMGATEAPSSGAPAVVAEGAAKPQIHPTYAPATATLDKIAAWYYETDELLEDAPFLRSSIDNRGLFELDKVIETYLITKVATASGVQVAEYASGGNMNADTVFDAIMKVKTATNMDADAVIINPADYKTLRLAKDSGTTGQYYGGGYFYGPYGNGQVAQQPGIWGLNTVITNAIPAGTALVGAFRAAASVITKDGAGARVEVVTGDHDDRTHNRVTVVVEERLGLALRVPAAFAMVVEGS